MLNFTDEAVVLKKEECGEADRFLTIYTKNHGKIRALAKGVRRPTSRKGGNLDLLTLTKVHLRQYHNFSLISEAKAIDCFPQLKKEIKDISKAYYLSELVDSLCPMEQRMPFVFDILISTLSDFHKNSTQKIWDFEYQLLSHLGFIGDEKQPKKLRSFIEGIIERELRTPNFYFSVLRLDR